MDEIDAAQVNVEALTKHPKLRPTGPAYAGWCLNCGPDVTLPTPMRWCDEECREDWEYRNRRI